VILPALLLSATVLLGAPWLVRRLLQPRLAPRTLVHAYSLATVAAGAACLVLLTTVLLRFAPHRLTNVLGLGCIHLTTCSSSVPWWLGGGLSVLAGGLLVFLLLRLAFCLAAGVKSSFAATRWVRASGALCQEEDPAPERSHGSLGIARVDLVLPESKPLAFTVGLLRPRVVVSRGLVSSVSATELEAVLAHEEAHRRNRDGLVLLLSQVLGGTFRFLPGLRQAQQQLVRAMELAADDSARRSTGDPLLVAASLHRVASLLVDFKGGSARLGKMEPATSFVGQGGVAERIYVLACGAPLATARRRLAGALVALVIAMSVLLGGAYVLSDVNPALFAGAASCASMSTHAG
jgi:hypothetical protein